jgi:hypothetical protein
MNHRSIRLLVLTCLTVGAALCGCHPTNPLDRKIMASSPIDFMWWRADASKNLDREQWREFDEAIQEIRFRMTIDHIASGRDAVDQAMRERINGRTVREVLIMGYRSRLDRLDTERAESMKVITTNARLVTRPGDTASADYLRKRRKAESEALNAILEKIRQAETMLKIYDPTFSVKRPDQPPATPTAVTPEFESPIRLR